MKWALDPDRPEIDYSWWKFVSDVASYVRPYKWRFFTGTLCRLISDVAWLYQPIALAKIIDFFVHYQTGQSLRTVWLLLLVWGFVSFIKPIGQNLGKGLIFILNQSVSYDIKIKALKHIFSLDIGWHERENVGNKAQRINTAADALVATLSIWINNVVEICVVLIGMPLIIGGIDKMAGLFCLAFMLFYLLVARKFTEKIGYIQYYVQIASENVSGQIYQFLGNVRTIKVLGAVTYSLEKVSQFLDKYVSLVVGRIKVARSQRAVLDGIFQLFRVGMFVYAIFGVVAGHYEVGFLVLLNSYILKMYESTDELATIYQELVVSRYGLGRLKEIFDQPIMTAREDGKVKLSREWGQLSITHLSFQYGENEVLNDISFKIKRGEKIGIVGLSGAGKSTLFKLLLKEYEDYKGEIKFDELSLREISPKDYYAHTAVVLQDTEVFNFSLKDNITIGRGKFDRAAFERALDVAHVRDFLHKLPQGVDTLIGEKGVKLSGGEKQRLGIARAVYKEPELLLLDEATSHLDIESEKSIQDSLHKFFDTVTAIVIAHRLTTIKEMDRIIVIEGGRLIEQGSFSRLMRTPKGRFRQLWKKQKI